MFDDEKADKLQIIKELMEQLAGEMKPSADDFEERLGRKKPGIEVMKIEGKMPMDHDEMMEDPDEEMGESPEEEYAENPVASSLKKAFGGPKTPKMHESYGGMMSEDDLSPQEKLKKRLMALRA